jgi:hypothetical protein
MKLPGAFRYLFDFAMYFCLAWKQAKDIPRLSTARLSCGPKPGHPVKSRFPQPQQIHHPFFFFNSIEEEQSAMASRMRFRRMVDFAIRGA